LRVERRTVVLLMKSRKGSEDGVKSESRGKRNERGEDSKGLAITAFSRLFCLRAHGLRRL
jgi:hypothetical protein